MQKTFHQSFDKIFEASKKALEQLRFEITYQSKKDGLLGANTGTTILSWGEKIDIEVKSVETHKTIVTVKSASVAQLLDWGKNETNEENVLNTIAQLIGG